MYLLDNDSLAYNNKKKARFYDWNDRQNTIVIIITITIVKLTTGPCGMAQPRAMPKGVETGGFYSF